MTKQSLRQFRCVSSLLVSLLASFILCGASHAQSSAISKPDSRIADEAREIARRIADCVVDDRSTWATSDWLEHWDSHYTYSVRFEGTVISIDRMKGMFRDRNNRSVDERTRIDLSKMLHSDPLPPRRSAALTIDADGRPIEYYFTMRCRPSTSCSFLDHNLRPSGADYYNLACNDYSTMRSLFEVTQRAAKKLGALSYATAKSIEEVERAKEEEALKESQRRKDSEEAQRTAKMTAHDCIARSYREPRGNALPDVVLTNMCPRRLHFSYIRQTGQFERVRVSVLSGSIGPSGSTVAMNVSTGLQVFETDEESRADVRDTCARLRADGGQVAYCSE